MVLIEVVLFGLAGGPEVNSYAWCNGLFRRQNSCANIRLPAHLGRSWSARSSHKAHQRPVQRRPAPRSAPGPHPHGLPLPNLGIGLPGMAPNPDRQGIMAGFAVLANRLVAVSAMEFSYLSTNVTKYVLTLCRLNKQSRKYVVLLLCRDSYVKTWLRGRLLGLRHSIHCHLFFFFLNLFI